MPVQSGLGRFGSIEIRQPFAGSEIVLRASARVAGAIDSLTWRGTEFINSYDHGRELQSAASFNNWGECFNPTEAGSRDDGTGWTSTSRLMSLHAEGQRLSTRTRMAFWLAPGEQCRPGLRAVNDRVQSDHELSKVVTVGAHGFANVIEHAVSYRVPAAYDRGSFEALTAYLPPAFSQSWVFDPALDRLRAYVDSGGPQRLPVILATADGKFALGVYSAGAPHAGLVAFGFRRWQFAHLEGLGNATMKWSCLFALRTIAAGDYPFTCYAIVGSLDQVRATMRELARTMPMVGRDGPRR